MEIKRYRLKKVIFVWVLLSCILMVYSQSTKDVRILFSQGQHLEEVKGELKEAIKVYEQVLELYPDERTFVARALLQMGICYIKMGNQEAQLAFQRIIEEFSDQQEIAAEAQTRLQVLKKPARLIADEGMITRQIWADLQTDPSGSISPDGRYLSYVDWGKGDLLVRDITTGINQYITKNPPGSLHFACHAIWSPDGREIAYLWFLDTFCELRIIGRDGSKPRTIFTDKELKWIIPGGWSPDGRFISAYLEYRNKSDHSIALISVENGDIHILKTIDLMTDGMGPYTQDGRFIVYNCPQSEDPSKRDICLLAADGSGEVPLIESPSDDWFLCFSPDGQWLLFLSDRSGVYDAWMTQVEDGKPKGTPWLIKPGIGNIMPLGISTDGVFYYSSTSRNWNTYVTDFNPQSLKLISKPKRINQRFVGSGRSSDWSPDGKYLAYLSTGRSMSPQIGSRFLVLHSLETGEESDLNLDASLKAPIQYLRWFPDNRSLLIWGNDWNNNTGFFRIDRQTADVTQLFLTKSDGRFSWPMLSPNGKVIYYYNVTRYDNTTRIMKKDLETGEEKILFQTIRPDSNFAPSLSPDGQKIVFQLIERKTTPSHDVLQIISTDGGEPVELLREQMPVGKKINAGAGFIWTPDGSHIIFSRFNGDKNSTSSLWIVPATGGTPQKLGGDMIGIQDMRIHPDGSQISFIAGRFIDEIWMLENFFPKK
ncbi:tetratricopeptide repeat protein [Acidobacteriota bacterium]